MHHSIHPHHDRRQELCAARLITFHPGHLDLLEWRPFDKDYTTQLPTFMQQVEAYCEQGFSMTMVEDGRVLACGGILPLYPGIAYAWLFGSTYLPSRAKTFTRTLQGWMDTTSDTLNLHRLQTVCHVDDVQGKKWVEMLGFIAEGTLRGYDVNQGDYVMYAKVKKEAGV